MSIYYIYILAYTKCTYTYIYTSISFPIILHLKIHSNRIIQNKIKSICTKAFVATLFITAKIGYK